MTAEDREEFAANRVAGLKARHEQRLARACVFCQRITGHEFDVTASGNVVSFEPLNPVTPGHRLFVPTSHVLDAAQSPAWLVGETFAAASRYGKTLAEPFNLITSCGPAATQSIMHLHVHYVPRRQDDGLHLPWTGQVVGS